MIKRLPSLIALSVLFFFGTFHLQAQNVDKVLARHYKKAGGMKNWKNLKSVKSNAKLIQQGMEIPVVLLQKHPNKQRIDMDFQGQKFIQAFNGKEGWAVNPFTQGTEPKMLTGEELLETEDQTIFDNPLIDYRKKGNTVGLEGTETVEGIEYDKVKLTRKNGNVHYYLFGKGDEIKIILRRTILAGPMKGKTGETYLTDYRPVGNLMMPFFITNKVEGQIVNQVKVDNCELDPDIEDSLFDFPAK